MHNLPKCLWKIALESFEEFKNISTEEVPVKVCLISMTTKQKQFFTNTDQLHAEEIALKKINIHEKYMMVVNLEPCPSCGFRILKNRNIKYVFFGAFNHQYGAFHGRLNLHNKIGNNLMLFGGLFQISCQQNFLDFFEKKRCWSERNKKKLS